MKLPKEWNESKKCEFCQKPFTKQAFLYTLSEGKDLTLCMTCVIDLARIMLADAAKELKKS